MSGLFSPHSYRGAFLRACRKAPLIFWCALSLTSILPLQKSIEAQNRGKPGPVSPRPKGDALHPKPTPNNYPIQTRKPISPDELAKIPKPGDGPLRVTIELSVDASNKVTGTAQVSLNTAATASFSSYVILPFRITSITPNNDSNLLASHVTVADRFSVLAIIVSPQIAPESKIEFAVSPLFREPSKPFMSQGEANYFVLQKREENLYTLLFHYDPTQILQVDKLAKFTDSMTVPVQFIFVMPEETDFRTDEPYSIKPVKKTGRGHVFVVGSESFGSQIFRVNYTPADSWDVYTILIISAVVALTSLGLFVWSLADDRLARRPRLFLNCLIVLLTLALVIFCVAMSGISALWNNLLTFIPAVLSFLLNVYLLIHNSRRQTPAPQGAPPLN
jgi:hypothetical protein